MNYQRYGTLLIAFALVIAVAISFIDRPGSHTNITISETNEEVKLEATFPDSESQRVHDYVKSKLGMTDLADMKYLEVKHYQTPDQKMRFHIKSGIGFVTITMAKDENSRSAHRKLRETSEGIEDVLAGRN